MTGAIEIAPGIIVPDAFKEPPYVEKDFNEFKTKIRQDYNQNRVVNSQLVKKLLQEIILDNKVVVHPPLNKKGVNDILTQMYSNFEDADFQWRYLLLTRAGFFLSSFQPSSFSVDSLTLPEKFRPRKQELLDNYNVAKLKDPDKALIDVDKAFDVLAEDVMQYFRDHHDAYPVIDLIDSGAKGGSGDIRKLLIGVGLSINANGEVNDVITRSHTEGLTQTQFFNYSSQAMVSQYKKSVETAVPGYLIRKLNTLMAGVILADTPDCGTKKTLKMKVTKENFSSLIGRMYLQGSTLKQVKEDSLPLIGGTIKLRSPLYCKAPDGVCRTCYNPMFIDALKIPPKGKIGLLASTSQANMLTSLTLKAAHTGLSLNAEEVDLNKDIYEYSE